MRTVEDKVHSHNSNCIYSVANLTGTLLSSRFILAWSLATLQDNYLWVINKVYVQTLRSSYLYQY